MKTTRSTKFQYSAAVACSTLLLLIALASRALPNPNSEPSSAPGVEAKAIQPQAQTAKALLSELRAVAQKSKDVDELVQTGGKATVMFILAGKGRGNPIAAQFYEVAYLALNRALSLSPTPQQLSPHEQFSCLLEAKGDLAGAIEHEKAFVDSFEASQKVPANLLRLAQLCKAAGRLAEAVRYADAEVYREERDRSEDMVNSILHYVVDNFCNGGIPE